MGEMIIMYDVLILTGGFKAALALKKLNPDLKVMAALGGGAEEHYGRLMEATDKRRTFIDSVMGFLEKHEFDGLDVAMESEGQPFSYVLSKCFFSTYNAQQRRGEFSSSMQAKPSMLIKGLRCLLSSFKSSKIEINLSPYNERKHQVTVAMIFKN